MQRHTSTDTRVVRARVGFGTRISRLWRSRELLVALVRKELKIKYKNSALGFAWSFLNPMLYLVVFYVAFQVILRAGIPLFPIYLLSGLLVWNLFSVAVMAATVSITSNAEIVKKVAFPREILPLAAVGAALVHFFLQASVLVAALVVFRHDVAWAYIALLPLGLLSVLMLAAGLGTLFAAVNVYLRDTQHFLELALLAWFWMTPIVYPFMTVGSRSERQPLLVALYLCNPITSVVITFQHALYNTLDTEPSGPGALGRIGNVTEILPHWGLGVHALALGAVLLAGIVSLLVGLAVFGRLEGNFAEEL